MQIDWSIFKRLEFLLFFKNSCRFLGRRTSERFNTNSSPFRLETHSLFTPRKCAGTTAVITQRLSQRISNETQPPHICWVFYAEETINISTFCVPTFSAFYSARVDFSFFSFSCDFVLRRAAILVSQTVSIDIFYLQIFHVILVLNRTTNVFKKLISRVLDVVHDETVTFVQFAQKSKETVDLMRRVKATGK